MLYSIMGGVYTAQRTLSTGPLKRERHLNGIATALSFFIPINTRIHILHTMLHTFPDVLIHSATTRTGTLGIDYPITKFF